MNNPLTKFLQSLPEKLRLAIYAVIFVGGIIFSVYQATDGDWKQTILGVLVLLFGGAMPASNTPVVKAKTRK